MQRTKRSIWLLGLLLLLLMSGCGRQKSDTIKITNVSYDPTREFYEQYNPLFEKKTGKKIEVIQSHGGSGAQARSVVEGCNADVVTLALEHDISLIERTGLIDAGWQQEFEKDSAPYTSTIVFLVRKGNQKQIKDWEDLVKKGEYELVTPSVSILAQPSVAIVDDNARANDSEQVSKEYLTYLYSDEAQRLAGTCGYRPSEESILKEFQDTFDQSMKLYDIKDYGGWDQVYEDFFDDGAWFDEIYEQ